MAYDTIMILVGHRISYFLLMAIGGLLGALFLFLDNEDRTMRETYKQTTCKIVQSEVTVTEHVTRGRWNNRRIRRTYYADIVYAYSVNGEEYEGDVYRAFEQGMTAEEATKVVGRYAQDQSTTCYYDPANPEEAVLTLDSDRSGLYTLAMFGMLFLFGGLTGWIVIDFVLPGANKASKRPQQDLSVQIPEWSSLPRTP
jgi:Protein of unknown function (DUF3592)